MGLAASQARYLFISTRMNDLEAGMMRLSAQQLRLTDQANDIEERRDYEANLMHLEFNGERNFTYDDMMGEAAMNNGEFYFLTTNDGNNRVVLNQKYTNAIKAAGIAEEGGEATQDALVKFMASAAGTPKSANDWKEVITGKLSNTDAYKPIDNFKQTYGVEPQQGMDPSKAVDHYKDVEKTEQISFNDILNKMGSTGNFNNISNLDNKSTGGSQTIEDQTNCNCSYADLVKKFGSDSGRVMLLNDKEKLSYDEIWSRARAGFRNLANTIANKIATAYGDSKIMSSMTSVISQMESQINGTLSNSKHHSESKAKNGGKDTANNGLIGVAIDKTGTDQVWVYCNASELTRRLLTAASNYMNSNPTTVTTKVQGAQQNYNENGSLTKKTTVKEFDYKEEHPYTNQQGYDYDQWHAAWDKVVADNKLDETKADEYRRNGYIEVEVSDEDKQTLNNYKQIFLKACSQGWKQDNDLDNTANLTSKLENMQYKVNGEVIKNLKNNFQTVKTNDQDLVNQRYDSELRAIKRQEKVIEIQQTAMQTELSALQTEQASVESIIDKNVQRGFNLFA